MEDLKISVVVCTYNGEQFLRQQLDSIINQTVPPYEIIIQDDFSNDSTWEIMNSYAQKHLNIKIFKNSERLGLNQNFLSAFLRASGNYIAISDQDDVWMENRLELYAVEIIKGNHAMVYSDSYLTDMDLNVKAKTNRVNLNIYEMIWFGMGEVPGHAIVFKKEILLKLKNLHEIDFIYDWLVNIAALAVGETYKVNEPLTYWRRHDFTVTNQSFTPPVIKYRKPIQLIYFVFMSLLAKKKLKNFKWQFENIHLILKNYGDNPTLNLLSTFVSFYKKESPAGILIATVMYFMLRKDLPFKERIKSSYLPIYKYYYYKRDGAGLRGA